MGPLEISERTVQRYIEEIAGDDLGEFHFTRASLPRRRFLMALGLLIPSLRYSGAEVLASILRTQTQQPAGRQRRVLEFSRWLSAVWSDEVWEGTKALPDLGELTWRDGWVLLDGLMTENHWLRVSKLVLRRPRLVVHHHFTRQSLSRRMNRPESVVIPTAERALHGQVSGSLHQELGNFAWRELPGWVRYDLAGISRRVDISRQLYEETIAQDTHFSEISDWIVKRYYGFSTNGDGVRTYVERVGKQLADGRNREVPFLDAELAARAGGLWKLYKLGPVPEQLEQGIIRATEHFMEIRDRLLME